jgi:DNA-binding transcriptional MerR regulator
VTPAQSPVEIPDKVFFRIGEVARITGVKPYVLRFWESEFKSLKPAKSGSGQRRYRRRDIEHVLRIKELLWERKFTIAGARDELRSGNRQHRTQLSGQQTLPMATVGESTQVAAAGLSAGVASAEDDVARVALTAVRRDLLELKARIRSIADLP